MVILYVCVSREREDISFERKLSYMKVRRLNMNSITKIKI